MKLYLKFFRYIETLLNVSYILQVYQSLLANKNVLVKIIGKYLLFFLANVYFKTSTFF